MIATPHSLAEQLVASIIASKLTSDLIIDGLTHVDELTIQLFEAETTRVMVVHVEHELIKFKDQVLLDLIMASP